MLGIWPHIPCPVIWGHIPSISRYILFPNFCTEYITVYTFPKSIWRHIPSISRYRYITVYDGSWPSYVSIWQIFSTYPCHGYWCSWYKNSYIWYMRAHPAQLCSRMLLWLVYACSSCAAFFPAAPGWPAWMRHICCARKARSVTNKAIIHSSLIRWHAARRHRASRGRHAARAANLRFKVVLYRPSSWGCSCSRQELRWIFGGEEALSGCWCWHRNENRIYDVPVVLSRCSKGQQLKKHMKIEN